MNLDKRIKSINDIQSVLNSTKDSVGKVGYLAKSIKNFKNLNKCKYGTVDDYRKDDECFCHEIKYTSGVTDHTWYSYFIPEDKLESKEEKYRPYTLTEFVNTYSLGDEVIMRSKDNSTIKHVLFIEYEEGGDDVRLGQYWYTFMVLFNNYEIYTGEGWKPFGVEEQIMNTLLNTYEYEEDIDFEPEWERIPVTLEVVKVSNFVPEFELEEQIIDKVMESNKEVMPLEKYIEELKFYHNLYSASGDEDSAEELLMYEQLISWLEELVKLRQLKSPVNETLLKIDERLKYLTDYVKKVEHEQMVEAWKDVKMMGEYRGR